MRLVVTICAALSLAGCLSTQEMPLAPNVVRIDTQAKGLLFTGQTVPQTMRAAAKATLDRGYSHFKFTDASLQQGSMVAGTVGSSSTNVVGSSATTVNGSYGGGFMSANAATAGTANATTFGSTSVIRAPTAGAAATVIMFHANEPGAQGAFDAEQVLKQFEYFSFGCSSLVFFHHASHSRNHAIAHACTFYNLLFAPILQYRVSPCRLVLRTPFQFQFYFVIVSNTSVDGILHVTCHPDAINFAVIIRRFEVSREAVVAVHTNPFIRKLDDHNGVNLPFDFDPLS